jgi:hypothetical protein
VKKFVSLFVLSLILCFMLISLLEIGLVKAAEHIFIEDDFESYVVGAFPSGGGWELWFNGAGTDQQAIVNNVFVSPTKSLKLLGLDSGLDSWAGYAVKQFASSSPIIGFEVAVRVDETNGHSRDNARVAFATKVSNFISREYALIDFQDSGVITSGGQVLQSYLPDTWYIIRQVLNRDLETYSVWVDGELKIENLPVMTTSGDSSAYPSYGIEAFSVSQCYNNVAVYFDDVKVFTVFEVDPKLSLEPTSGIATTTLVGSGFVPNSKISVTWNDTTIHTVPNPLISDSYGNFTAIISVLNQTSIGPYVVKTNDEMGNEATAIFNVIPEFPSLTPLLIVSIAVMAVMVIYKRKLCARA